MALNLKPKLSQDTPLSLSVGKVSPQADKLLSAGSLDRRRRSMEETLDRGTERFRNFS